MTGLNYVRMRGFLQRPKFSATAKGFPKFNATLAVPISYKRGGEDVDSKIYYNICAFGDVAEGAADLAEGTPLEIEGRINTRSYDAACKSCGAQEKKYWTEVQVDNFIIVFD